MKNRVLQDIAQAPVILNILPHHSAETICRYVEIMHEEDFRVLEVLARQIGRAHV